MKIVLDWGSCQIISDSASNQLIPAHSRLDRAFLCCRLRGAGRAYTLVGVLLQALVSGCRLHNGGIDRRVSRWHSLNAIHWRWRAPKLGENQGAGFPAAHVIERRSNEDSRSIPLLRSEVLGLTVHGPISFTGGAVVWKP